MSTTEPRHASRMKARALTAGYGNHMVLDEINVDIPADQVTTIIGPNGCGKSTLLRAMSQLLPTKRGTVMLDGTSIERIKRKELATRLAILPQAPTCPEGLSVADLVARGRHPHQTWLKQWSSDDETKVADALNLTGARAFAERAVDSLSGGQRQRVWISMVLAQDTDLLFLDEPTTYLDWSHSIEILDLVHRLCREEGRTIVMVLHDLNLAVRYSDNLIVMNKGKIITAGSPANVINSDMLTDVFHLNALVIPDPVTGGPLIVPKAPKHIRDEIAAQAEAQTEETKKQAEAEAEAERIKRATKAYEEVEAAEEAAAAAREAAKLAETLAAKKAEAAEAEAEAKAAVEAAKKAKKKAKEIKKKAEAETCSEHKAKLASQIEAAEQAAEAKSEEAQKLREEQADKEAEAKEIGEKARTARKEAIQAQAWVEEVASSDDLTDDPHTELEQELSEEDSSTSRSTEEEDQTNHPAAASDESPTTTTSDMPTDQHDVDERFKKSLEDPRLKTPDDPDES